MKQDDNLADLLSHAVQQPLPMFKSLASQLQKANGRVSWGSSSLIHSGHHGSEHHINPHMSAVL